MTIATKSHKKEYLALVTVATAGVLLLSAVGMLSLSSAQLPELGEDLRCKSVSGMV
jgi:hypothetical protein